MAMAMFREKGENERGENEKGGRLLKAKTLNPILTHPCTK